MIQWTKSRFTIEVTRPGIIVLTAINIENPNQSVAFELSHELAAQIAEVLLLKAAYVEYEINKAVERMTEFD